MDTVHWHVAIQGMVNEIISTMRESRNAELKVENSSRMGKEPRRGLVGQRNVSKGFKWMLER